MKNAFLTLLDHIHCRCVHLFNNINFKKNKTFFVFLHQSFFTQKYVTTQQLNTVEILFQAAFKSISGLRFTVKSLNFQLLAIGHPAMFFKPASLHQCNKMRRGIIAIATALCTFQGFLRL